MSHASFVAKTVTRCRKSVLNRVVVSKAASRIVPTSPPLSGSTTKRVLPLLSELVAVQSITTSFETLAGRSAMLGFAVAFSVEVASSAPPLRWHFRPSGAGKHLWRGADCYGGLFRRRCGILNPRKRPQPRSAPARANPCQPDLPVALCRRSERA